jgi:tetratricopeptide (TPR) repeat protein
MHYAIALLLIIVVNDPRGTLASETKPFLSIDIEVDEKYVAAQHRRSTVDPESWTVNISLPDECYGELYFRDVNGRSIKIWTTDFRHYVKWYHATQGDGHFRLKPDDVSRAFLDNGVTMPSINSGSFILLTFAGDNGINRLASQSAIVRNGWSNSILHRRVSLHRCDWQSNTCRLTGVAAVSLTDAGIRVVPSEVLTKRQRVKGMLRDCAALCNRGEYTLAIQVANQVLSLGRELIEYGDLMSGHEAVALAHMFRGTVYGRMRDSKRSAIDFHEAANLLGKVLEYRPTFYFTQCLAISQGNLGEMYVANDCLNEAVKQLHRTKQLIEVIARHGTHSRQLNSFQLRTSINLLVANIRRGTNKDTHLDDLHTLLRDLSEGNSPSYSAGYDEEVKRFALCRAGYCEFAYGDIQVALRLIGQLLLYDLEQYGQQPNQMHRSRCGTTLYRFAEALLWDQRMSSAVRYAELSAACLEANDLGVVESDVLDFAKACLLSAVALVHCRQFSDAEVYIDRAREALTAVSPKRWVQRKKQNEESGNSSPTRCANNCTLGERMADR